MVELLPSVDAWCSYMGWTLLALGLLSCLFARTFKLGVLVMVLGNIPLILGIAAPRRVMEWVINQGVAPSQFPTVEQSHTLGIASALILYLLLFLIYWYPLRGRKGPARYFWQNKTKRLSDDDPIMGDDGLLDSERTSKNNNKRTKNKARTSTLHLKSGDNPLSLKDTSKAHDELTQLDADREPTLSSDLFTKRGPRRAAARALARTNQGATPTAGVRPDAAAPQASGVAQSAAGRAMPSGTGVQPPAPSLGSFLSRLDAMTSGASVAADIKPRSAIPDAVIPGGMELTNEPHVSSGVNVSGQKVGDLLHDLSDDESARRSAEAELKARMQAENTPHQGGMSFSDILSSASSRQSKLEARQDGFAPDSDAGAPQAEITPDPRAAAAAHGLTVRPSARKSQEPTPVDEALQEQGALADDEIELSRRAHLSAAEAASEAKTKLYSPGRTVGQALAELDQAVPAEAEVISSEQHPRTDEPSDEDLITALSAADVEIVSANEISERALNEAAAAHAQDIAPERVQHIKSLEAELEAKEAALKAREAAIEAQQAALKAKEAMLALDKNESKTEPAATPSLMGASKAEPSKAEPSKADPSKDEPSKAEHNKADSTQPEAKPTSAETAAAPAEMPSASYSFVLKAPHQAKEHPRVRQLPQFMGDSTSYSFELDFKSNAYAKRASQADAPTKQLKVEATFSAEDETKRVERPHTEPIGANLTHGPESPSEVAALKAQVQAERRALSELREQKDKEVKRQRDEMMWQRAERVAHELLSEAKSLGDEIKAPTTAAQLAERAGITPTPAKDLKTQLGGHLPYALTADYTDAGQEEARSLAALLKGDSDLALTVEKVKAQTDAALIAHEVATEDGFKSLGAKSQASAAQFSLQEDSAEVERMFEQITRVLQENSEAQLATTPAASVAPLPQNVRSELARDDMQASSDATFQDEPAPVGQLKVQRPAAQALKIEPAAKTPADGTADYTVRAPTKAPRTTKSAATATQSAATAAQTSAAGAKQTAQTAAQLSAAAQPPRAKALSTKAATAQAASPKAATAQATAPKTEANTTAAQPALAKAVAAPKRATTKASTDKRSLARATAAQAAAPKTATKAPAAKPALAQAVAAQATAPKTAAKSAATKPALAQAAATTPKTTARKASAASAVAEASAPKAAATKVTRTLRPATLADAAPNKAAPAPAYAEPVAKVEVKDETLGNQGARTAQKTSKRSSTRPAPSVPQAAVSTTSAASPVTKSPALKPRTARQSEATAGAEVPEVKSVVAAQTSAAAASGTEPAVSPQPVPIQGESGAPKTRHSLKTRRRSAAPEPEAQAPGPAPAGGAQDAKSAAKSTAEPAAPQRRATLKSHSLKRVRPQSAAPRSSGE